MLHWTVMILKQMAQIYELALLIILITNHPEWNETRWLVTTPYALRNIVL